MHVHLSFLFYTLIESLSDDSRFACPDIRCFTFLIRCTIRLDMLRGTEVFLSTHSDIIISFFYSCWFCSFLDSLYIAISHHFFSVFICYHVWMLICDIAVIMIHFSRFFIACSDYFRLSVYTWGILLAYIRRWLSLRLYFPIIWEAGCDGVFLVSEPGFRFVILIFDFLIFVRNLVHTGNLKHAIVTLQYTYIIHIMILSLLVNWSSSLWNSISWSFDIHDSNTSFRVIWIPSWFLFFFWFYFPDSVS